MVWFKVWVLNMEVYLHDWGFKIFLMNLSKFESEVHHYNHYKQPHLSCFSHSWQNPSMDQLNYLPSLDGSSCAWIQLEKITQQTDWFYFKYLTSNLKCPSAGKWTAFPNKCASRDQNNNLLQPFLSPNLSTFPGLPKYHLTGSHTSL